jgi:hypothetical protein
VGREARGPEVDFDMDDLVGPANETLLDIEGNIVNTLIDNGSQVSTLSEDYYNEHLSHLPLNSLDEVLQVQSAGDHTLPYSGYIAAQLKAPEMESTYTALVLIVPTTT